MCSFINIYGWRKSLSRESNEKETARVLCTITAECAHSVCVCVLWLDGSQCIRKDCIIFIVVALFFTTTESNIQF